MYLIIPIKPFPAKRLNWKWGRFTKTAIDYHNKKIELEKHLIAHRQEIMDRMIQWCYHIQFHTAMPDSWSKKKRLEMNYKPNTQVPDIDNLYKAFSDTVFFWSDLKDSLVWSLSASKHWAEEDKIIFIWD